MRRQFMALAATLLVPMSLASQTLSQRVAELGDATLRLSFSARRGVCGNGAGNISISSGNDEWEGGCEHGPVRVSLQIAGGRVLEAHTYVGGRWRPQPATSDLGTLPAASTAADLLALAERASGDAEELIQAAALADSAVVWPRLAMIAHNQALPLDTRKHAVFWLGQAAQEAATRGLDSIATDDRGDVEIRKEAVFALSQRPRDEGVPVLIHIARSNPHAELRKSALFWLGQSEDPRALALFEELLR